MFEALALSHRLLQADVAQKQPVQKSAAQALLRFIDGLLFRHFQRAGGRPVLAYKLIDLVQVALQADDREIAAPDVLGDDRRHQARDAGNGQRLHQHRRINLDNAMAIMQFHGQIVLFLEKELDIIPEADDAWLEFVRYRAQALVLQDYRLLGQTRHSAD